MKLFGTYIKRLVPMTIAMEVDAFDIEAPRYVLGEDSYRGSNRELVDGDDFGGSSRDVDEYEEMEKAKRELKSQKEKVKGYLWPDGRVRPTYNAHGTTVGRISCSGWNSLNVPSKLRDLLIPEDGHTFVGADADQIHMRITASRWGLRRYLDAFAIGADPHAITAWIIFGELFRTASGFADGLWTGANNDLFIPVPGAKWSGDAKMERGLGKTAFYAFLYKALVETGHRIITAAEDDDGNLIYRTLSLEKVRMMRDALLEGAPEIVTGWDMEIALFHKNGHVIEPVLGRRFDLLDGESDKNLENKIVNAPIIGAEASLMNRATVNFVEAYPFDFKANLGLVHQNYDSMCAEVALDTGPDPLRNAKHVAKLMQDAMTQTDPTLPGVTFTATAQWGPNLKEA
jgi:hypothetical protein